MLGRTATTMMALVLALFGCSGQGFETAEEDQRDGWAAARWEAPEEEWAEDGPDGGPDAPGDLGVPEPAPDAETAGEADSGPGMGDAGRDSVDWPDAEPDADFEDAGGPDAEPGLEDGGSPWPTLGYPDCTPDCSVLGEGMSWCGGCMVTCAPCAAGLERCAGYCVPEGTCPENRCPSDQEICELRPGKKWCGYCSPETEPITGCATDSCEACYVPEGGIALCDESGGCAWECSSGYVKTATGCERA